MPQFQLFALKTPGSDIGKAYCPYFD